MQTALGQTHNRDALGRISGTQEVLLAQTLPVKSYGYDTAGRLSSATIGTATTTWGYDANGNRTTENGAAIASYDSQDRLNTWKGNSYQYNPAGDLSAKTTPAGTTHYSYDNQGGLRQVKLASGGTIDYAIDPAGRRTGKRVNGQLQWQLVWLDNLRPIAKLKADNTLEAVYYYGGKPNVPEVMDKGGKTYRIISDQNGSVRLVIDASSGEVAQQMDYDVWGKVISDTNPGFQPFGFAGGLYDPDTQLTRFGARDYDAETGRWTAKDPILFNGGDSNLYGYVAGDPINGIDPLGLMNICINGKNTTDFSSYPGYIQVAASYIMQADSLEMAAFKANSVYTQMSNDYQKTGTWTQSLEDHRNAEHYMFALDFADRVPGIAQASLAFATPIYTGIKALFGTPPQDSPASFQEIGAGYMGISDSLSLLPGGGLKFTNGSCGCD